MKIMLDTNTCIYIIKQKPQRVLKHFRDYFIGDICISSLTLAELQYGVAKSQYVQKNQEALNEFVLPLEIAHFAENAARLYGEVRANLEKAGKPIGSMDTLIGAHALSIGATLVTNNTSEFRQIKGLKVMDWTV